MKVSPRGKINSTSHVSPAQTPGGGSGSGLPIYFDPDPPAVPADWAAWWNTEEGSLKVYYTDANTSQWVDANAGQTGQGVPTGGTAGQVLEKIDSTDYNTQWATPSSGGTGTNSTCEGRLTLASGVPVTTTDQTAKTTIYWTPFRGNNIGLYNGSSWDVISFAETSIALGTLTNNKNYDVFAYNNSGTLALELSSAWTGDTTRADALVLQDGIYCKSGTLTRRYLGTFRTTSTTTTEDSAGGTTTNVGGKRFLWNYYNRVHRVIGVIDTTDSWSYTTATWRAVRATAGNMVELVVGISEDPVTARAFHMASNGTAGQVATGVGVDSSSANSAQIRGGSIFTTVALPVIADYRGTLAAGYHYLQWLEISVAAGTTTWYGDIGNIYWQTGLYAECNG